MKFKNKNIIIIIISICCIITALTAFLFLRKKPEDRLTEAEIAALREEYPIRKLIAPPHIDMWQPTLEFTKQWCDGFVYVEVTKVEVIGAGFAEEYGSEYLIYDYTFTILDGFRTKCKRGDIITISDGSHEWVRHDPPLKEGMKLVCWIVKDENEQQYAIDTECSYYVTDDGYVISSFDEEKAEVTPPLSGIKLKQLIKELKK